MASNTQELNNTVASIMPVTEQEKAVTSRVRARSLSPDLFEKEEVRIVKKVCQRPAARIGRIEKYRVTCNKTNPYAGTWSTALHTTGSSNSGNTARTSSSGNTEGAFSGGHDIQPVGCAANTAASNTGES
ncbi:uncharacterized protein [Leptinotarsa decemlineata]|uniref:uncharacterized protein n=1 Tax=Leptinotarsa decemlineata TaxID=7539 RepID=UPI003D308CB1